MGFFSIILKMKKPRRRASRPGTAGTPHRNTLINTGSLEELKPPATSCPQTGESAEHLLHILLRVMRNRHTHTHTHCARTSTHTHTHTRARTSSLNFEHCLCISLWSFDSISVLRETDEIRALTSTHERSSHKHTCARTHSKTRSLFEEMTSSSAAVSPGVKAGWKPVPSQRRLPRRMVITHLMRDCYDEGDYGYTPQPAPPSSFLPHLSWIDSTAHY